MRCCEESGFITLDEFVSGAMDEGQPAMDGVLNRSFGGRATSENLSTGKPLTLEIGQPSQIRKGVKLMNLDSRHDMHVCIRIGWPPTQ